MASLGGARPTTSGGHTAQAQQAQAQAQQAQAAAGGLGSSLSYGSLKNRFLSGVAPKPDAGGAQGVPQAQGQQPAKAASKLFSLSR